jgi:hypothetical protein
MARYNFQEHGFQATVPSFSMDASQLLEDKIRQYSGTEKTDANKHMLFAYRDALRIIRKLEGLYIDGGKQV